MDARGTDCCIGEDIVSVAGDFGDKSGSFSLSRPNRICARSLFLREVGDTSRFGDKPGSSEGPKGGLTLIFGDWMLSTIAFNKAF